MFLLGLGAFRWNSPNSFFKIDFRPRHPRDFIFPAPGQNKKFDSERADCAEETMFLGSAQSFHESRNVGIFHRGEVPWLANLRKPSLHNSPIGRIAVGAIAFVDGELEYLEDRSLSAFALCA